MVYKPQGKHIIILNRKHIGVANWEYIVIPIFEDEQEHTKFIEYVKGHREDFKQDVENQNVDEMFPEYSKDVNTAVFYKLGKTLVQWLDRWRQC